jgi:hypothetical protein
VTTEIFEDLEWQMSLGERAALTGLLVTVAPALAIEIGTAQGACLQQLAAHSGEIHSFDLVEPTRPVPANATLHTGDSHVLLPALLAELAEQGRNVDLALVDGDHTPEGVRRDLEDLLNSPAVARTTIVVHDTANERVREGLEAARFAAWPKVWHVDLDAVPGHLFAEPALRGELWYGLGLILVDSGRPAALGAPVGQRRYYPSASLLAQARDHHLARERNPPPVLAAAQEALELRERVRALGHELDCARHDLATAGQRIDGAERALKDIKSSASWRLTAGLRVAKQVAARARR